MRYEKQIAVPEFGEKGQKRLSAATIAIAGCGALGCLSAQFFTRMGAGEVRIADGDHVSLSNLHRQVLFTEEDACRGIPKVEAVAHRLASFNSEVRLCITQKFVSSENIDAFLDGADILIDATDSMPARFLFNDVALKKGIPWIYTGVSGSEGIILPVLPGRGPCLRCLFPEEPPPERVANCGTGGILPITAAMAVSLQTAQALRILLGTAVPGTLLRFNVWNGTSRESTLHRRNGCLCSREERIQQDSSINRSSV